jgi:hypothetical protein
LFYRNRLRVHGTRCTQSRNICLIVIQHREQPGCGNTASGSAWDRWVRLRRCDPHPSGCVHPSRRAFLSKKWWARLLNPLLRRVGRWEIRPAAASTLRCNWRERFLSGSSPFRRVRIAITPDTVHPAYGAAIAAVPRDELSTAVMRCIAVEITSLFLNLKRHSLHRKRNFCCVLEDTRSTRYAYGVVLYRRRAHIATAST